MYQNHYFQKQLSWHWDFHLRKTGTWIYAYFLIVKRSEHNIKKITMKNVTVCLLHFNKFTWETITDATNYDHWFPSLTFGNGTGIDFWCWYWSWLFVLNLTFGVGFDFLYWSWYWFLVLVLVLTLCLGVVIDFWSRCLGFVVGVDFWFCFWYWPTRQIVNYDF